ncbi:cupin domain-containing protein [Phaeovulum sp.]|uniref:cupin domain-containing protein n=1 Tax=Phaeovulum sp. TaxID=2934796 RepID=UPI0039E6D535
MSLITRIDPEGLGEGTVSHPTPDRLLEGNPVFTTWMIEDSAVQSGIWQATPGTHKMIRDNQTWELFTLLQGKVEITEEGGESATYQAGDTIVVRPNFRGTWRTIETVKKVFVSI